MNANAKKWIARALIVSMVNPALFVPTAMARDTDIFSGFLATETANAIEPNILILLDTSDSMNLAEAWKPYPGEYDSHVEYLWNDLNVIVDADAGSGGEVKTDAATNTAISTAAVPQTYYSKFGFWSGETLADRQALWQAARNWAKGTEPGDTGLRTKYRNYNDLSWIYWLPTGADETDQRLTSPSWNKFRGYIKELGNGAGGSQVRGGPNFTDTNNFQKYNQCGASLTDLTPSTVFVPSSVDKNSGKFIGQQWARWEPYLNLTSVGVAGYPGSTLSNAATTTGGSKNYPKGYVDITSPNGGNPASNQVYRDSYDRNTSNTNNVGSKGLPIRFKDTASGSGWDEIKADNGGANLIAVIDSYNTAARKPDLETISSWYGLPATSDVDSSGATDYKDAQFIAWKGNSHLAPLFGKRTGAFSYYDDTPANCDSSAGPLSISCLKTTSGGVSDITLSKTLPCTFSGASSEKDAAGNTHYKGGSCSAGTVFTTGVDTNGATKPNFADIPDPTTCAAPATSNDPISQAIYSNCQPTVTQVTAATTCSLINDQTVTIGPCAPTGGSNINVGTCAMSGTPVQIASCSWNQSTLTIKACAVTGRSAYYTEGLGWRATGGTCTENGSGSASGTYCGAPGVNTTIYATEALAKNAPTSCPNTTAAGTYKHGGECKENGSSDSCQVTGGTTILGAGFTNVNATCSNKPGLSVGTYTYGGTCTEGGAAGGNTSICNPAGGGTTMTIRGLTKEFNQSCTNKANSLPTINQPGSYSQGQTCAGTNNTCTTKTSTNFTIKGASYTRITACNSVTTPGTYHQGGTCSGTNVPCAVVTPYGGTPSINYSSKTWYPNVATCTPPTGAQSYNSDCKGTKTVMPGIPPGGNATTTNNTQDACSFTKGKVTIAGTEYTNYANCANKAPDNSNCQGRYAGADCTTSCAPVVNSDTGGGSPVGTNYFRTYNYKAKTDTLYHDCKADDGPAPKSYMHYNSATRQTFGNDWHASNSYSVAATGGVADSANKVNMYSVNYLNWKFGPKVPTLVVEHDPAYPDDLTKTITKTVNHPIGRKTRLQIAKDVLVKTTNMVNGVRMGLMSFNQMEKDPYASSGAHLDKAIDELGNLAASPSDPKLANRTALIASINALKASSATPLSESLFEAYRYFKGDIPWFGGNASGTNYPTVQTKGSVAGNIHYVTEGMDTSTKAIEGGKYKTPIETCQNNMVILVSDGSPENDWSANAAIKSLPDITGMPTGTPGKPTGTVSISRTTPSGQIEDAITNLPYGPTDTDFSVPADSKYVLLDELASYMYLGDINPMVGRQWSTLSTIKFGIDSPLLDHAAEAGGGKSFFADKEADLLKAILDAINVVEQWQPQGSVPATTFSSTTGKSGDVYQTAFSPSDSSSWPGTVKKYRWGFGEASCGPATKVVGDNGAASCGNPDVCLTGGPEAAPKSDYLSPYNGAVCAMNVEYLYPDLKLSPPDTIWLRKIQDAAISYWIPAATPDGGSGEKGGTGQVLIGKGNAGPGVTPDQRQLYTFIAGVSTNVELKHDDNRISDANTTFITQARLGAATPAERSQLIGFAQGSDGVSTSTWRSWAHFDSVHSAPTVVERDEKDPAGSNTRVVVEQTLYYLTSDGVLHAVDTGNGTERWAFMVEEGLPQIANVKANPVGYHLEVADGSPALVEWRDIAGDIERQLLVFGMRRGGRAYYALDVTYRDEPKFAWKITPSQRCTGVTCTSGSEYAELGQAWSTPAVGTVRGYKDGAKFKPVLIFGGGYDANQDLVTPGDDTMGRAIFVADASNGQWLHTFSTEIGGKGYSVPSDVLVVDATGDSAGTIDRAYVGDTGGNLWRMDLDDRSIDNPPGNWSIVRLANLSTATNTNKLFNRPTMAPSTFKGKQFDAIFVGGGDTQRPTASGTSDSGSFFMVKDFTIGGVATQLSPVPVASSSTDFVDITGHVAPGSLTTVTKASSPTSTLADDLSAARGGYVLKLSQGEKVTSSTTVVSGLALFGTYFPKQTLPTEQCQLGGYGNQYVMDALTGLPDTSLGLNPQASNAPRVYGHVGGFGVGVGIISSGYGPKGQGPGIFLRNIGTEAGKLKNSGTRTYWYSVPEVQN